MIFKNYQKYGFLKQKKAYLTVFILKINTFTFHKFPKYFQKLIHMVNAFTNVKVNILDKQGGNNYL